MNPQPLGATGLMVTPIGLGMAALGRPGYITIGHAGDLGRDYDAEAMEAHAHLVLDEALALGVRYYDAARSYGSGEAFLGRWRHARGLSPDAVTVGSKWGYTYTADWQVEAAVHEVKDHSLATLERQLQETRESLDGEPHLYQIHSATFESGVLDDRAVLDALARLKGEGVAVGLSLSGPNQADVLKRAFAIRMDGRRLFDCVQATWNLLEPSAGPTLEAVRNEGMGVIVKEALANGRLAGRVSDPAFADRQRVLQHEADRLETSVDALALRAVLAQPWADVVLSGAATVAQIRSNVRALDVPWDAEAAGALGGLAEDPQDYWRARSNLAWN